MLVTNTGYYATLPDGVAIPVEPGDEISGLHAHVDGFRADPDRYLATGLAGYRHVKEEHSAESFAENLEEFLGMAEPYRLRSFVANFSRQLGSRLNADMNAPPAVEHLRKRMAGELSEWIR